MRPENWVFSKPKGTPTPWMVKWWSKYRPVHGVVVESISPYRLEPMSGLVTEFTKGLKRNTGKILMRGAPFVAAFALMAWMDADFEQRSREHWH